MLDRALSFLSAHPNWRGVASAGVRLMAFVVITLALTQTFPQLALAVALLAAALLTGSALQIHSWPLRSLVALITWAVLVIMGFWATYEVKFGPIGYDDFIAIFQTDANEAASYLSGLTSPESFTRPLFAAVAFLFAGPWRRSLARESRTPRWRRRAAASLLWIGAPVALIAAQPDDLSEQWQHFVESVQDVRAQRAEQQGVLNGGIGAAGPVAPAKLRGTIILVLGESLTRRHMSLYGYSRPTTPNLDSLASELFVQTDTVSLHSHTTLTVPPIFGIPLGRRLPRPFPAPLIGSFERSGVKTFWYSNQNELGTFENPVTLVARTSDVWQFQRNRFLRIADTPLYDGWLVPRLEEALKDPAPAKFVTLHFYAPHWPYCEGFPASSTDLAEADGLGDTFFGPAPDWSSYVNCYDNAIRYVDGLWGRIIGLARDANEPTAVVFISDHGENPAAMTAHDENKHSAYQVEIPLVWYVNDAGRRAWQPQLDVLRTHLNAPFSNAYLGHSLLDLAGADHSLFDTTRSLFSPSFEPITRDLFARDPALLVHYDTLDADRKDGLEIARDTLRALREHRPRDWEKTWAHGVNSVGKLLESKGLFAGIALDVCFDASRHTFQICDPSGKPAGLSLEAYLHAARDQPGLRLWLTWHEVRRDSFSAALADLARLDGLFKLRSRTVVETGGDAVFPELKLLAKRQFVHAYRLPTEAVVSCSDSGKEQGCAGLAGTIARSLEIVGANALSFDGPVAPFVRQHPRELGGFRQLTQNLDISPTRRDFTTTLPALDPYTAFLVGFRSTFDR